MGIAAGLFDYPGLIPKLSVPFKLGLDLLGGTELLYKADLANTSANERASAMEGVRDVIERRVNLFGVKEPQVSINRAGEEYRLIVELAGVKDIAEAIKLIGETPFLEFQELKSGAGGEKPLEDFQPTRLTGQFLKRAQLQFNSTTNEPIVGLEFNDEGTALFSEITSRNVGKPVAIFLDRVPISAPRVQEAITTGRAQISGRFTIQEARTLAERLNAGALPVPIQLLSQRSVGASLGQDSLQKSIRAGLSGFLVVSLFMMFYYRLPGLLAVVALALYTAFVLAIFKLIPVTLTLAGIAGFILSIGMAVDANILIFERLKEELRRGKALASALEEGFKRAWTSIRDSNISTLISALILYTFTTSIVKGFALTLGIGVLVSMFSAITVTRLLLKLVLSSKFETSKLILR